jgi:hypothetical protein
VAADVCVFEPAAEALGEKERKAFFSEEKKQKTFILRPWPGRKSFLVLFFKKEHSYWGFSWTH